MEPHHLGCKPDEPIQGIGQELPCKQEAHSTTTPIVLALGPTPQPLQELNCHFPPPKPSWVGPTL